MDINRAVYAKAILELLKKPSSFRKHGDSSILKIQESPKLMPSFLQNLLGDVLFLEPDDYLSAMILETRCKNAPFQF